MLSGRPAPLSFTNAAEAILHVGLRQMRESNEALFLENGHLKHEIRQLTRELADKVKELEKKGEQ
jgi:hypothetical protein